MIVLKIFILMCLGEFYQQIIMWVFDKLLNYSGYFSRKSISRKAIKRNSIRSLTASYGLAIYLAYKTIWWLW